MIISLPEYKFIYIRIPKTGSTSIADALKSYTLKRASIRNTLSIFYKRPDIKKYAKNSKRYFKFSFVRNPWDRMISRYVYGVQHGDTYRDFDKWLVAFIKNNPNKINQLNWIEPIKDISFIGRFETLQEDFNSVCNCINIPTVILPHRNKSKRRKDYRHYYTTKTKNIVNKYCQKDIDTFHYSF